MMLVGPQPAASKNAPCYSARPITIERVAASKPYSRSQGPSKLKFAFEATTPLLSDNVKDPPDASKHYLREVFWHIQPDYRLVGPINVPDHLVLGTDGHFIYLRESKHLAGGYEEFVGRTREDRIWSLAPDGQMELVEGPWTEERWALSVENAQSGLGKVFLVGWPQEPRSSTRQTYFALKEGRVEFWGEDRPFIPKKSFPEFNFAVQDDGHGLSLKSSKSEETHALSLPHTMEHGWWESLNIDRYGWLFAEGYGNDYAIKLNLEKSLNVDQVHRFTGRSWFGRLAEWLFGIGPETDISSTQWSSQCADFSPTLRLTLFCDPAKVLREGVLQDFPQHSGELDRYLGDASGLEVALIKGPQNELYAFDGEAIQLVSDSLGSFVKAHDVPEAKRTFVTGGSGGYELTGSFPNLALVKLADRTSRVEGSYETEGLNQAFRRMTFMSAPGSGGVLGINRNSVWHIGEGSNDLIWQASNARILTSEIAPVADWDGLIFLTEDSRANLIKRCSE
ncbi:hypothetical protein [Erythrobacter ani]|uniref:Uncharacterized protein n=1 Tax=Erythrobacter ani TaxID=2827235 RepID=A0ABS6SIE7_9SPHN|nr:hypothetical protein [Erythrobacter ani]MBV7264779.1 hypothetical protein [Erythrobacter ani]